MEVAKLIEALRTAEAALLPEASAAVVVGYTQAYGIYVHENLEARHPVGQAKFLEQPARENRARYGKIAADALRRGKTMSQALLLAGLALQADSQRLCPVDKGLLRASAFTRLEDGGAG